MKRTLLFTLTAFFLIPLFFACDNNATIKEKAKLDSIAKVDSINSLFSNKTLGTYTKYRFVIKNAVLMVLADNKDTYIVKGNYAIDNENFVLELYKEGTRDGRVILLSSKEYPEGNKKLLVTRTIYNALDEIGYQVIFECFNLSNNEKCQVIMHREKGNTYIQYQFDLDSKRKAYRQNNYFLVVGSADF